jgi:hypothetical protein
MNNIFRKLGIGVADFVNGVAGVIKDTVNVAVKIERFSRWNSHWRSPSSPAFLPSSAMSKR